MDGEPQSGIGRRRSLVAIAAVATAGLAGCSWGQNENGVGNSGATDVIACNGASEPRTVTITVTEVDSDTPHTSRTLELSPGETVDPVNSGKLPTTASSYRVEATVENGPSETFDWEDPSVELAPLWVRVDGSRNIKFLLQAG